MGNRANIVLVDRDGWQLRYSHWAGCRMLNALLAGPGMAERYIRAQEVGKLWTDELWADGGLVLDLAERTLLFFGEELMATMNERRAMFEAAAGSPPIAHPSASLAPVPAAQPTAVEKPAPSAVPVPVARPATARANALEAPAPAPAAPEKKGGRKCKKCGADMRAEARICVQCGAGIPKKSPLVWGLAAVVVVAAAVGGWLFWKNGHSEKPPPSLVAVPIPTNKPPAAPEPLKEPKSPNDLKVSALTIEKSKSTGKDKAKTSELMYAVGTVKNESDWQRFGVKVTCELFDAKGENVGTATDYIAVIEPRKPWHFRALALDKKAASARLKDIKEDD